MTDETTTPEVDGEIADIINAALLEIAPILAIFGLQDTFAALHSCFSALLEAVPEDGTVTLSLPESFEERIPAITEQFQAQLAAEADYLDDEDDFPGMAELLRQEAEASVALDDETQSLGPPLTSIRSAEQEAIEAHIAAVIDADVAEFEGGTDAS